MSDFPFDHLSPSSINKYVNCPLSFLYYKQNRPKVWDPRYAEQGRYTHSMIQSIFDPAAEIYKCDMDAEMRSRHDAAMAGFSRLYSTDDRYTDATEFHPELHVEVDIEGVPLMGFIDLLTVRGSKIFIDDWKTGVPRPADKLQLQIYTMMVSETMGIDARNITATLCYLRDQNIQRIVPYSSTNAIRSFIIRDIINPVKDLQFVPMIGKQCDRCEYRHLCEAW